MNRVSVLAALIGACLVVPGYAPAVFSGLPLGAAGLVLLVAAVFMAVFFRNTVVPPRAATILAAIIVLVAALKVVSAVVAPRPGWLAQQYANDRFEPPARNSLDFDIPGATRIDPAIDFADDYLPLHFLNEGHFNTGIRREVTEAVSVRWTGHVSPGETVERTVTVTARGGATLSVDGAPALVLPAERSPHSATARVRLAPGAHELTVAYVKTANTDPLIRVDGLDDDGSGGLAVTPWPATSGRRARIRPVRLLSRAIDAALLAAFAWLGVLAVQGLKRPQWRRTRALAFAMFALFTIEGVYLSSNQIGRAEILSGGDDWHAYEARAREVFIHGFLMQDPQFAPGHGELYDYPPFYSYYLAAVHRLGGDGLFAPLFSHFILLFATNVVVYRIARKLYGEAIAIGALAALVAIEQIAFVRHYTTKLFTENVYVLLVALIVYGLVEFMDSGRQRTLVWTGVLTGVAMLTRPAIASFLPFAALVTMVGAWRTTHRIAPVLGAPAILFVSMFAVTSLAVARNYVVAGDATMFKNIPASSAVEFNLPETPGAAERYVRFHDGTLKYTVKSLFLILIEHPREFLIHRVGVKLAFSFGALNVMQQNFHPELVLVSFGYLAALVALPSARQPLAWPIHGFVVSHLGAMVLTMPSNYGYRLILPMYIFFPIFGAAVVARVVGVGGAGAAGAAHLEAAAR